MRRFLALCFVLVLFLTMVNAEAEKKPEYTLSRKDCTVLQDIPDRNITPQTEGILHEPIAGESPVTGLPWEGEYLPMLVQISNSYSSVKVNGGTVKAAGIGKITPWGIQYADIIYEVDLAETGWTRLSALFSDSFSQGQPKGGVGPVRSTRRAQLLLREEWQSGFVYSGGFGGTFSWRDQGTPELLRETGALEQGVLLNLLKRRFIDFRYRVKGKKAPDNLNADIVGLRSFIPASFVSRPRPFLFADENPYVSGYELADTINLEWGNTKTISHFLYDESKKVYFRYCGAGNKESKWVPYISFASAEDQSEEGQQQLSFANLIVQRVAYEFEDRSTFMLNIQSIGKGNADIFIGGRYIPGYWVRPSIAAPTVYYDDQGNELMLSRGKTFIAQFPPESLCTFAEGTDK